MRQGFTTKNQGWNPGPNVVNSTTAIGFWPSLFLEGFGQSHSARYYNPTTGRFMSRDPEDGNRLNPTSLHKYLYAGGDPVNAFDPSGRGALWDAMKGNLVTVVVVSSALVPYGICAIKEFAAIGQVLSDTPSEIRYLDYTNIGHNITACVLDFFKDNVGIPLVNLWKLLGGG